MKFQVYERSYIWIAEKDLIDPRSYTHNLSSWEIKAWKSLSSLNVLLLLLLLLFSGFNFTAFKSCVCNCDDQSHFHVFLLLELSFFCLSFCNSVGVLLLFDLSLTWFVTKPCSPPFPHHWCLPAGWLVQSLVVFCQISLAVNPLCSYSVSRVVCLAFSRPFLIISGFLFYSGSWLDCVLVS